MVELYRCIVPVSKVINDNSGQHYKTHMGKLDWLTNQFNEYFIRGEEGPGGFKMPDVELINGILGDTISIRCEIWRCKNTLFDPQNYAKTFKAPIDLLVHNGYIKDDNWKFIDGITYCGGGVNAWGKRAIRCDNDGLPDELVSSWWDEYSYDYNDVMIRILAE